MTDLLLDAWAAVMWKACWQGIEDPEVNGVVHGRGCRRRPKTTKTSVETASRWLIIGGGRRGGHFRGEREPGQRLCDGALDGSRGRGRGMGMWLMVVSHGGLRFVTRQRSMAA